MQPMKRAVLVAATCILAGAMLPGCKPDMTSLVFGPDKLTSDPGVVSVEIGESADVTIHIFDGQGNELPADYWLPRCTIEVDFPDVAEVTIVGGKLRVVGKLGGKVKVRVTCPDEDPQQTGPSTTFEVDVRASRPVITAISPNPVVMGTATTLTITGTGFLPDAGVEISGDDYQTTFVSSTELRIDLPAGKTLLSDAPLVVKVFQELDEVGSPAFTLPVSYPVPVLTLLNPSSAAAGSQTLEIVLTGLKMFPKSVVRWQGIDLVTTYVGYDRVKATVPAALLATPGVFLITVFNPAPGGGTSNTLSFDVTGSGALATFDFTSSESTVLWAAVAQGSGAFVQTPIVNKVVQFPVTAPTASFAFVTSTQVNLQAARTGGGANPGVTTFTRLTVFSMTREEMTAGVHRMGFRFGTTGLSGTVTGLGAGEVGHLLWGNGEASTTSAFSMTNASPGPHALAGYRSGASGIGATDRAFMRLNQPSAAGVIVDFNGPESAPVATATATLSGLLAGDQAFGLMGYSTEPTCEGTRFYSVPATASRLLTGIPASLQGPNDVHIYTVVIFNGTTTLQQTFNNRSLIGFAATRPPPIAPPPVTNVAGAPYQIKQAAVDLGSYNAATLSYSTTAVTATKGFLGGATGTIRAPDLSAVSGWNSAWAPLASPSWTLGASTSTAVAPTCASGTTISLISVTGTN
jgi:hypothetical protein